MLLVGWDAADWKVINPLLDAGLMPSLAGLVERGVMGNLATLDPPLSPMLWTSIATGKTADQHGILGFVEPRPDGSGLRPVLATSRRCKALWNILNQEGYRCHVVGWWPSHPAEPLNGVTVSNLYQQVTVPLGAPWPLPGGTVHPVELAETMAGLRIHPAELTAEHLLPFVPRAAEVDQEKDRRLRTIAKIIAEAASVHAAATWVMEHVEWDFVAVYYDAIDHFSHAFMDFHPPRRPGVPKELFGLYGGVVSGGYLFHDMMLDRLLQLAGPEATVVLVSDHGFHPDHLRPRGIPREPAGPAVQHREQGVLCLSGDGLKRDELIFGASLLDVTPTVLALLGLPVGRDMRGKPLVQAFERPPDLALVDSWEELPGDSGQYPAEAQGDPWSEREAMRQLEELGYVEPPGEDQRAAVERHSREARFYLARVLMFQGRVAEALPDLELLYREAPEQRYGLRLAACYRDLGRAAEMRAVVEALTAERERRRAQVAATPTEERHAAGGEQPRLAPGLELLWGQLLLAEGREAEALERLHRAEQADPAHPMLHLSIGSAYLKRRRWADAERAFARAVAIDPDSAAAHHGLAVAHLRRRRWRLAAASSLHAVALRYAFPAAHFHLGEALARLGSYRRAAEAFEVCLAQAPRVRSAHLWLASLYRLRLGDPDRAAAHLAAAERSTAGLESEP